MGRSVSAAMIDVPLASNFQSVRTRPTVRALISSCNRLPAAFCKRISAVAPGNPLHPKPYRACMGRGFGKLGGVVAVTVFSQEAPEAAVARPHSSEIKRSAVRERSLTTNSDERGRLRFNNAGIISGKKCGHKKTRGKTACFLIESKRPLRLLRAGGRSRGRRRRGGGTRGRLLRGGGRRLLVQGRDHLSGEIHVVLGMEEHRDAVHVQARLVENEVELRGLHALHDDVGDFFDDAFPHAHGLFLELALTSLTKLVDLALHVLKARDLLIPLLGLGRLGVRTQGGSFELLAELVDLLQRLFVILCAIVVFLLRGILGFVDLFLRVLGFGVLLERAVHVDSADFKGSALSKAGDGKDESDRSRNKDGFFHNKGKTDRRKGLRPQPLLSVQNW